MNTVIICDDNEAFCDILEILLQKYKEVYEINIVKFYDGKRLLDYCRENRFDILYLDVDLGEVNGLDIARTLKKINPKSLMIYISAYDCYYTDMVNTEPFRFISKDNTFNAERLEKELVTALSDAIDRLVNKSEYTFEFSKSSYTIDLAKVKYFYSIARTIHICGDIGSVPSYFYHKIDELQEELRNIDNDFVRISKSYIVNINYVKVNEKTQVIVGNKILSVTSKYRNDFLSKYYFRIK